MNLAKNVKLFKGKVQVITAVFIASYKENKYYPNKYFFCKKNLQKI